MTPVIRRNPNWLPDVFNGLFDTSWVTKTAMPAVNILETDQEYQVEMASPGLTKDDYSIKLDEDRNLVITMEKKTEAMESDENKEQKRYLRREFSYNKFQRKMVLPENVVTEKISAKVENGVLTVFVPKMKEEEIKKAEKFIDIL